MLIEDVRLGLTQENVFPPTDCKAEEVHAGAMCQYGSFSPEGLQGREGEESVCFLLNLPETLCKCQYVHSQLILTKGKEVGVCWSSLLGFLLCFLKLQNRHVDASLIANSLGQSCKKA